MISTNRRRFLECLVAGSSSLLLANSLSSSPAYRNGADTRSAMDLTLPSMKTVRFGFIGVGRRGSLLLKLLLGVDGAVVNALCDTHETTLSSARQLVQDLQGNSPATYGKHERAYLDLLQRDDLDAVIIATPWSWHVPMALACMAAQKQTFVEVPAALTVDDCWKLVEASERHQVNCMMMENVCYGREEMMAINLVRSGVLGELLHGEAAYIHPLRWQMKDVDTGTGSWRTKWHTMRNANLYPTHGLGPIAQYMDINRGDRFDYMTSISSPAIGRQLYADKLFPEGHQRRSVEYICGDMNTSLIKTIKGRSIMVQYDTTTPRPYTRHNMIVGTNGIMAGFPNRIALENNPFVPESARETFHRWDEDFDKWFAEYDHPIWREVLEKNQAMTHSNSTEDHMDLDYVMLWRIVYCLRNGLPLDQNVYDAAAWSVVTDLSEKSVAARGQSVDFPDFTKGKWKDTRPVTLEL